MSEVSGAGSTSESGRSDGASGVSGTDDSVSEAEASSVAADAMDTSDAEASTVGESIAASTDTDTFESSAPDDGTRGIDADAEVAEVAADLDAAEIEAADEAEEAEEEAALEAELEAEDLEEAQLVADAAALEAELEAAPVEEPGIVDQALDVAAGVGTYLGQTFKGYATGAANMYLDYNNAVNWGVNKGLEAAGVDYRFADDLHIEPTSPAEYHAQNALEIASVVAGGYGAVKSAPAIARGIDATVDAARGLVNGNRATRVTAPGAAAATTTTTVLGDLRPHEIARIQAAADELGHDLYVVGSAAKGARRNVDTDLPLAQFGGTKAGTRSDIDYAVRADLDDLANQLDLPDVDGSWGVRGVDFLNLDNSPAIRFSPGRAPEFLDGAGRFTLD